MTYVELSPPLLRDKVALIIVEWSLTVPATTSDNIFQHMM